MMGGTAEGVDAGAGFATTLSFFGTSMLTIPRLLFDCCSLEEKELLMESV